MKRYFLIVTGLAILFSVLTVLLSKEGDPTPADGQVPSVGGFGQQDDQKLPSPQPNPQGLPSFQ